MDILTKKISQITVYAMQKTYRFKHVHVHKTALGRYDYTYAIHTPHHREVKQHLNYSLFAFTWSPEVAAYTTVHHVTSHIFVGYGTHTCKWLILHTFLNTLLWKLYLRQPHFITQKQLILRCITLVSRLLLESVLVLFACKPNCVCNNNAHFCAVYSL